jgi:hypothetical protein
MRCRSSSCRLETSLLMADFEMLTCWATSITARVDSFTLYTVSCSSFGRGRIHGLNPNPIIRVQATTMQEHATTPTVMVLSPGTLVFASMIQIQANDVSEAVCSAWVTVAGQGMWEEAGNVGGLLSRRIRNAVQPCGAVSCICEVSTSCMQHGFGLTRMALCLHRNSSRIGAEVRTCGTQHVSTNENPLILA